MPSSTGSELPSNRQADVYRLWVACVNCSVADRQATWDRGLVALKALAGPGFQCAAMEDALQDAGFRLGIFHCNALSARFYSA
jgi:hypothetical protein